MQVNLQQNLSPYTFSKIEQKFKLIIFQKRLFFWNRQFYTKSPTLILLNEIKIEVFHLKNLTIGHFLNVIFDIFETIL